MSHYPIPLSLYIHMPWCVKKCPYCDFNSHTQKGEIPEARYIQALINDLKQYLPDIQGRVVQSIFIGGGTPSLFSAESYALLFDSLKQHLSFSDTPEITLEANPGSAEREKFSAYRQVGINRLSLGIQSFNEEMLKRLGRVHNSQDAHLAIQYALEAGFDNFNLDIMHTLPHQTVQDAMTDLNTALSFSPPHLSWYQLTLEANTFFYKHPPSLPNEDIQIEIEKEGKRILKDYHHYEISAYCRGDSHSQHNLNYWLFGDYLGVGAGAHGKLTVKNTVIRTQTKRQPDAYLKDQSASRKTLSEKDKCFEFMLNATRLSEQVPKHIFRERTFLKDAYLAPYLQRAESLSLLTSNDEFFQVTEKGHRFLNNLQSIFLD